MTSLVLWSEQAHYSFDYTIYLCHISCMEHVFKYHDENQRKRLTTYLLNGVLLPKDIQLYTEYISGTRVLTPTHKYAQILYLLYLEYASRCAGYVIQDKNPIKSLTFHNSMRGPFAFHAFYSSDEIYSNIIAGRVPRFSDLNISPAEKPRLDETIATVIA